MLKYIKRIKNIKEDIAFLNAECEEIVSVIFKFTFSYKGSSC
jgi:hypothetical protein